MPADSPYLALSPPPARLHRPLVQGDVFVDIPIATASREAAEPKINRGPAILLGHPCSIYAGPDVYAVQFVAAVRPVREAVQGRPFTDPWNSHLYLFPLPALIEGEDYVADFRRVGTTHFKNLEGRRIACLTKSGWAALQRRWAWFTLRADLPLSQREADLAALWNEMDLWEKWSGLGLDPRGFPDWLNQPSEGPAFEGTRRRDLLDFAADVLAEEMPGVA
jgi:hypothetical protein